ncbi:hypothetical protein GF325_04460 [Candidatus Bathyarchaeota archaeon]|nr:hypothetical protein [Candidatus Bathyarchaeota archaeon]
MNKKYVSIIGSISISWRGVRTKSGEAIIMTGKYLECDLCEGECPEEKIDLVFDDPEFTKSFVDNMMASKMDEVVNDCYLMAEVISGASNNKEIAEFAFCLYVHLSHLIEIEDSKRIEIAKQFKKAFKDFGEQAASTREIAKSKESKNHGDWIDIQGKPKAITREKEDDFLKQLDDEIAEIEEISDKVNEMVKSPPSQQPVDLKPVISKIPGSKIIHPGIPATKRKKPSKTPPLGSKDNPIKLTEEMLSGVVSDEDLAKVEMGIKVKRIDIHQNQFRPEQVMGRGARQAQGQVEGTKNTARTPKRPSDESRREYISNELFNAFNKAKKQGTEPRLEFALDSKKKNGDSDENDREGPESDKNVVKPFLDFSIDGETPAGMDGKEKAAMDETTCSKCGAKNKVMNRFCSKCGKKL